MTDDNLPEDLDSTEDAKNETLDTLAEDNNSDLSEYASDNPASRTPRGNRPDEPEVNGEGLQDYVNKKFTRWPVLLVSTTVIVVVSLLAGWLISAQDAPGIVDPDWATLNGKIIELREAVNQNSFQADLYASEAEELSNPDARAWFHLEIASALIAVSTQPDNVDQLPPQFRQQQQQPSSILAGDQVAIQNRVTNLQAAYQQLEKALEHFSTSEASKHALGTLGHYRAEYSAAYVSEILLLLGAHDDFERQREIVVNHLNNAKTALPRPIGEVTNSTDRDIKALLDQIDSRQTLFEQMSESQVADISEISGTVDNSAIYSWIGQYINAKNVPESNSEQGDGLEDSTPTSETPAQNTGDDGDFEINDDSNGDVDSSSAKDSTEDEDDAEK